MKRFITMFSLILVFASSLVFLTACGPQVKNISTKHKLDLSGMSLVFEDQFDGDTLDLSKWSTDRYWDGDHEYIRRGGYWHPDQISVNDGKLTIRTEYLENGEYGSGWYTGMLNTKALFEQKYGYFEIRCKAPAGEGLWSAFWLLTDGMAEKSNNGEGGAEIDIFESPYYNDPKLSPKKYKNTAFHTIHHSGYGDDWTNKSSPCYRVGNDIYENFNTYGVLWTEDSYTFYVNGYKTWTTKFGVSKVPEYLIVSVEIAGEHSKTQANPSNKDNEFCWSGEITNNPSEKLPIDFEVDYVKVYKFN